MRKVDRKKVYPGKYEIHCTICGAELGFFDKGAKGENIHCCRCKSNLSFMVMDGETIVRGKQVVG